LTSDVRVSTSAAVAVNWQLCGNADWHSLSPVGTSSGARTSLFVPELDRLFLAERAGLLGSEAAIAIYRPTP
jgi:hypothetical protein